MLARLLTCLLFATALAADSFAHDHKTSRGRLVFSYADRPMVGILDLDTGEVTDRFEMPLPNSRLVANREGRYVFIITGDANGTVRILDTGLTFDQHGDHVDIDKGDVKLLDLALTGVRPSHIVAHADTVVVFYDGVRASSSMPAVNAKAMAIDVASLATATPKVKSIDAIGPQHGLAVALGNDLFAVTTPNPAYAAAHAEANSLPLGIAVRNSSHRAIAAFDDASPNEASCPLLHGHAAVKRVHVFGCASQEQSRPRSGVLVVQQAGKRWKAFVRTYPDDRRVSTLRSLENSPFVVGNYGTSGAMNALIRVDTRPKQSLRASDVFPIPDGQSVCQFAPASQSSIVNLTPDGKLRVYRALPVWHAAGQFDAVSAFDCAFNAKESKPSLAVQNDSAFVSDPVERRIREYNLKSMRQGLDMPIDGIPGNLAYQN